MTTPNTTTAKRRGGPPKRTPGQREQDLIVVSEMYLDCKTCEEIAQWLSSNRPYQITRQQVHYDIQILLKRWQTEQRVNVGQRMAAELRKLERIERKASDEWERSKADKVETEISKSRDGDAKPVKIKKTTNTGDPRYLEIQVRCIERRAKLLGIDAPERQEHSGPDGGPIPFVPNEVPADAVERARKALQEQWEAEYNARKQSEAGQ